MVVKTTPEIAARIRVVRYRERYMTCASCQSAAVGMVMIDGKRGTTTCLRHVDTWVRRAVEQISGADALMPAPKRTTTTTTTEATPCSCGVALGDHCPRCGSCDCAITNGTLHKNSNCAGPPARVRPQFPFRR